MFNAKFTSKAKIRIVPNQKLYYIYHFNSTCNLHDVSLKRMFSALLQVVINIFVLVIRNISYSDSLYRNISSHDVDL